MKIKDNPFVRWELNPKDDRKALTTAMQRKSRQLREEEREAMREDWRSLLNEPVQRARWMLLTPPQFSERTSQESPWELAQELLTESTAPDLPKVQPTLEEGLILPGLLDSPQNTSPPFLPKLLTIPSSTGGQRGES